jgi:alpha-glucosidase
VNATREARDNDRGSHPLQGSEWWQRGVVYQVYPRSFQDSNGDGIGDLAGLRRRLDYLNWLGVDALWISPIYPSPMADFGYDIADYCNVDPLFGTLADFDGLIEDAHCSGLKVILDFVPNHTSNLHPWFLESRATRGSAKRDWYLWRDPAPSGGPPNNWLSNFGGSAWELDTATGQYYYHAFLKEQPDLNWRNAEVCAAMHDVLRFWLARGVDGFRVDVIWHLIKDDRFRDNPPNPAWQPGDASFRRQLPIHSTDRPEVHDVIAGMRRVVEQFGERVLIGEIYLPVERLVAYYGRDLTGVHLPFNFQLLEAAWNPQGLARLIQEYERLLPTRGWPNWVLGNHDKPRIAARVGAEQARIAAMLLLTLRGSPTMYYGDEIGLAAVAIPPERIQDPWEKNEPGIALGRDPARTPMQWDAGVNAGFTTGSPWLPLSDDFGACNVTVLADDPRSILALYRNLLALRRRRPALSIGSYAAVPSVAEVLAYERRSGAERLLIALNFGRKICSVLLPVPARSVLLSTHADRPPERSSSARAIELQPNEGIVLDLSGAV